MRYQNMLSPRQGTMVQWLREKTCKLTNRSWVRFLESKYLKRRKKLFSPRSFLAVKVELPPLQLLPVVHHLLQVLGLGVVQRLEEVLLDVVVQRVLQVGHLLQGLAHLDQRGREDAGVLEVLQLPTVGAHRVAQGSCRLWIGRSLGLV